MEMLYLGDRLNDDVRYVTNASIDWDGQNSLNVEIVLQEWIFPEAGRHK